MSDKLFRFIWKTSGNEADGRFFVEQDGELCEADRDGMDYVDGLYTLDWFTGFSDSANTPVYENDLLAFPHDYWTRAGGDSDPILAVVTWDKRLGAWTLVNTQNSAFRVLLSKHVRKGIVKGRKE